MSTNAHDSASPTDQRTSRHSSIPEIMREGGLTKREYFSSNAPPEVFSVIPSDAFGCASFLGIKSEEYIPRIHYPKLLAIFSVRYADALIEELNTDRIF